MLVRPRVSLATTARSCCEARLFQLFGIELWGEALRPVRHGGAAVVRSLQLLAALYLITRTANEY